MIAWSEFAAHFWSGAFIGLVVGLVAGAFGWTALAVRQMQREQAEREARVRRYRGLGA